MIQRLVVKLGVLALVLVGPATFGAAPEPPATQPAAGESLDALLEPIRAKRRLPGMVGAIVEGDRVIAIGAAGVRKLGGSEPITIEDKLHIGSCTKAMTATVLARLVERKQLAWESTIAQVFPDLAPNMDAAYRDVTLEQLLHHRAGLPANTRWNALGEGSTTEQRVRLVKLVLGKQPESPPGSKFLYSNVGYAVAAAMGEKVTGRSWEQLIQEELFDVLGMSSAGFGAPGTKGQEDQPWGHLSPIAVATPAQGDNPPVLGPAGRVHCSIRDWAKFVSLHLRGNRGEEDGYLSSQTFARLHAVPADGDYAMGWIIGSRGWAGGTVLSHAGSNTMWYCVTWIAPKRDFAVLAVTNIGGMEAARACDEASSAMIKWYLKARQLTTLPARGRGG